MKHWLFAATTVLIAFMAIGCSKKDDSIYTSAGYEQLNNMEISSAEESFRSAIDAKEELTLSYRGLGICLMNKNDYEGAIEAFTNALHESGSTPSDIDFDINYYLGVCYHKLSKYQEAKERYDAILVLRPKETDAYIQRATEYLYMQDADSACADFDTALSLDKKNYSLYIDVYALLKEAGYEQYGVDYLNAALSEYDKYMSNYDKGYINYCLGNYPTAKKYLEDARSDGDKSPELLLLLGHCYEELNETSYAINIYMNHVEKNPDAGVYNQLAVALMKEERYDEALEAVVNGLEFDKSECRQELLFNRVVIYEYLGDYSKASELAAQYLVDYPSDENMTREYLFLSTR